MNIRKIQNTMLALVFLCTLAACEADSHAVKNEGSSPLTLDMIYSYPSIVGTAPAGYSWSADSSQLMFLWNEDGHSFRDVWSYTVATGEKRRLTQQANKHIFGLEHKGINEAVWLDADTDQFAYVLEGKLYRQGPGGVSEHFETDKNGISKLSISPDGQYLSFISNGMLDTSGETVVGDVLWLRSVNHTDDNSARRTLGQYPPKVHVKSYEWSANSTHISFEIADSEFLPVRDIHYYSGDGLQKRRVSRAFPGDETERYNVGVITLETSVIQMFERPDAKHDVWNYGLSTDGKSIFVNSSDMLVKEHTVYVFDVATGERQIFYQEFDAKHLRPDWQVEWAPGDDGLIILTDKDGYLHLYHQKATDSEMRPLTSGQWEIASFTVDPAGDIYFLANKSHLAERQLYSIAFEGGALKRVSESLSGTHQPVFSPSMSYAASHFSSDSAPADLYMIDLETRKTSRVTKSPQPAFYEQQWANIQYVEFNSHIDGTPLIGRVSYPATFDPSKQYPLIVGSVYSDSVRNQWGGRTSHPTWGLDQYLVSQDYIILNVNVRGSWGQGRAHNQGLHYSYGGIDIEDLHSGVQYLISEGYVDADRVGIWGSSYGGLMTMMSLFKKPGVYAAGIAGAPATNVAHAYPGQMWVMGEPSGEDHPARYERQSALYQTEGLVDPLMIVHGSKDDVVLYADTIRVIEKLIADEKMFELVTLPGTGHGWDNEDNATRRFAFKKMVAFFDRHLKPRQASE